MDEDVTSTSSSGFTSDGGAHGHLVRWPEDSAVTSTFIDGPRFVEETVLGKIRGSENQVLSIRPEKERGLPGIELIGKLVQV